jgi:hypothetical protein
MFDLCYSPSSVAADKYSCAIHHAGHKALLELEEMMRAAEEYDDPAHEAPEPVLGAGDLLDDFVQSACQAEDVDGAQGAPAEARDDGDAESLPDDPEQWDFGSAVGSADGSDDAASSTAPECDLL